MLTIRNLLKLILIITFLLLPAIVFQNKYNLTSDSVKSFDIIPAGKSDEAVVQDDMTLDKVFDGIETDPGSPDSWTMISGGDVMIGRTVNYKTITYQNFDWPYVNLINLLSQTDFNFVNLESSVIENCPIKNDGMIFCGDVNHIQAMAKAPIHAVSLANNHALNQGIDGLETTIDYLMVNNILAVGVTNPVYKDIKGTRVAFLGYTDVECYPGVACVDFEKIKSDIELGRANSDLVIIMYHWGSEYRDFPTQRQVEIAHFSINAGADLILGNHPHWIQPIEVYKDKLIVYSHGNLIFDQMWSQKTKEGVLVEFTFNKNKIVDANLHPVLIEDYGQPQLIQGSAKEDKIEFIKLISEQIESEVN